MNNKVSPYNKTSDTSKGIINNYKAYPSLSVEVVAKMFGRSIACVRYLKGVANGNN